MRRGCGPTKAVAAAVEPGGGRSVARLRAAPGLEFGNALYSVRFADSHSDESPRSTWKMTCVGASVTNLDAVTSSVTMLPLTEIT